MITLGIDIGGTKTELCLCDFDLDESIFPKKFHIQKRIRFSTERDKGYQDFLKRLIQNIDQNFSNRNQWDGIGIGLPGSVHPQKNIMIQGNSQIFKDQDIINDLQNELQTSCPILVENDANCFILAEALMGIGQNFSQQQKTIGIGIILGTGVGAGVFCHQHLLTGAFGGASELGHICLVPDGHDCYCGQKGCVEQYLSGPALEKSYSLLSGQKKTAQQIFEIAPNEAEAKNCLITYKKHLAHFLLQLTNIYDPHFIVLGGGLSQQREIYANLEEHLKNHSFLTQSQPKVFQHSLGDSAGVLGAAYLVAMDK